MLKLAVLTCLVAVAYATKPYFGYPLDNESIGLLGSRIAGGADASRGEFPHQVSLQWGLPPILPLSHLCGGSILNENWILTAAHCPLGVPIGDLWVKAGKHLIKTQEKNEQTVKVAKAYTHSKYTGGVGPYDISLLKLSSPLVFNEVVQPIALPQMEMIHEGDVTLSGWGSISTSQVSQMPDTLQKAELPIVEINACKTAIDALGMGSNPLHETNVCTGPLTGGVSACSGDSGGPLIKVKADGKPEVIGIVSWGIIPCGSMGAPSVYTRVSAYIDWIQSTMASHS